MRTVIESLGVYLPANAVSTDEVLEGCDNEVRFPLEDFTGISSRRVVGEGEFSIDLARKATLECLGRSRYEAGDVDLLVCANISRLDADQLVSFEPSTSMRLKAELGFERAFVFDLANACAGMWTAIGVADAFFRAGLARVAMVVSGEYTTHLIRTAQKELSHFMDPRLACLTVGDAGAAVLLEPSSRDDVGLHALEIYTLGRYSDLCIARPTEEEHGGAIMLTDSLKLSAVTISEAVTHSVELLDRTGWPPEAIQHLIPHQTSRTTLRDAVREINSLYEHDVCGPDNTIDNLRERGNTASTSHFVALWDNMRAGRIRSGEKLVFSITGSGVTIGTALYTLDDLPERMGDGTVERAKAAPRDERPVSRPQARGARIESVGTLAEPWTGVRETITLAESAAEDCLRRSAWERSDVDVLVYAGVYRTDFVCEPAMAPMIAGALGMNDVSETELGSRTLAFDVFNGAIGFLNACYIASTLIQTGDAEAAMVVTSEVENNRVHAPDSLLGLKETGSAMLLDKPADGGGGFGTFVFDYFPDHVEAYSAVGVQRNGRAFLAVEQEHDFLDRCLDCIPGTVRKLLAAEGLELPQVDVILAPQISSEFLARLAEKVGANPEQVVDVTAGDGAYFSSSLAYGLRHAADEGRTSPGDVGLVIDVGTGIQVGCALYSF